MTMPPFIDKGGGVTEWFDEYENNVNHVLWPSQSPELNPVENLWVTVDRCVRQRPSPPSLG